MNKEKKPAYKRNRVQVSAWLPVSLVQRVKIAAAKRRMTSTAMLQAALEALLSNQSAA